MVQTIPFKNYRPWAGLDEDDVEEDKPNVEEYKLTAIEEVLKLETMY